MPRACDRNFEIWNDMGLGLTFDDVLLKPKHSTIPPHRVSLETRFSIKTGLKIPIVSSPMDTVTESRLAIPMAMLGGLGIIHRNLSPEAQVKEVRRVKFYLSGMIATPITFPSDMTLSEIENKREKEGLRFYSFPIVDEENRIIGIVTENDFDFSRTNLSRPASAVMTRDLITAPPGTTMDEAWQIMIERKKKVLPIVNDDRTLAGMYLFSDVNAIKTGHAAMYNVDEKGRLRVGAAVGVGDEALRRVEFLVNSKEANADVIVIDAAHGDCTDVIEMLRAIKNAYPHIDVMAGNISEGPAAVRLVEAGADSLRVGQGSGSICTTREVAGYGNPQLTAVYDVARAIEGSDVPICSDGGIRASSDITKAIGAGAHFVMLGSLLAATKEAPGEVRYFNDTPWKFYRGMGSQSAMEENPGSRERYKQMGGKFVPEGVEGYVPFAGEVKEVVLRLLGGLRAGMGVGYASIEELREKAEFRWMTRAGSDESHPHDIRLEPPHFRR